MQLSIAVFAFSIACLASLLLTPLTRRLAVRLRWRDRAITAPHKAHRAARPNAGGLAVLASLSLGVWAVRSGFSEVTPRLDPLLLAVMPGALLIAGVGLLDDLRGCRAIEKLVVQVVGLMVLQSSIDVFGLGRSELPIELAIVAAAGVALWMLALTNAMNLIDGLDGLATGLAAVGGLGLVSLAMIIGDLATSTLAAVLTGASLGFLRSNRAPAKIYLGDSGSMLLGFLMAAVGAMLFKIHPRVEVLVAVVLMGWVPLVDTGFAVVRRTRSGASLFQPDRDHLHHRLIKLGLSTRLTALSLCVLAAIGVLAGLQIARGGSMLVWTSVVGAASLPLAWAMFPLRVTTVLKDAAPTLDATEAVAKPDPVTAQNHAA